MELRARVKNNSLDVGLQDKQTEDAPKPKFRAFGGSGGQTLGGGPSAEIQAAAAAAAAGPAVWDGADESKPKTKLQVGHRPVPPRCCGRRWWPRGLSLAAAAAARYSADGSAARIISLVLLTPPDAAHAELKR